MPGTGTACLIFVGAALRELTGDDASGSLVFCLWAEVTTIGVMKALKNTTERRKRGRDILFSPFD